MHIETCIFLNRKIKMIRLCFIVSVGMSYYIQFIVGKISFQVTAKETKNIGHQVKLLTRPARMSYTKIRCCLHWNITTADVHLAINKFSSVTDEFAQESL